MSDKFNQKVTQMGKEAFKEVADHLQSYITDEKRDYPRDTVRRKGVGKTGRLAGSPRDVVDTGELRDSFKVTDESSGNKVRIKVEWTADHAGYVYAGHGDVPPYPWVHKGLRDIDWQELLKRKFNEVK